MEKIFLQYNNSKEGFALLYTVLVISAISLLMASVFSLAQKETILSLAGEESSDAWYAADSGIECALYSFYKENGASPPHCYGEISAVSQNSSGNDMFFTKGDPDAKTCAQVLTRKNVPALDGTTIINVNEIVARGFSSCDTYTDGGPKYRPRASDPYLTERRIRVRYDAAN